MSVRQTRAIALAVALFAFAAVVLEIALVRMYSALLGQHFGVAWAMVLPLGVGIGALVGVFTARRHPSPFRAATLAHVAAFAAPTAAISVIVGVRAKGIDTFDAAAVRQLALYLGTSLLPFVFAGVLLSKALGASGRHAPALVKTVFAAAGCGIVAAAFVMRFGPARVGLGVAVAMSLAAVLFARASRLDEEGSGANRSLVATFVLGLSVVLAGEIGAPYLKLASLRWTGLERVETQIWTNQGFYTVDKPQSNSMLMRLDGTFGRSIPDGKQLPPLAADELAYLLNKGQDPVLVVGVGGGREVRAALRQGHKDVRGVEEDVTVARGIMRGSAYGFSGELYDKPEVHVSVEGAKSYIRRNKGAFQRVIVGYSDTQAASPTGALSAVPNWVLTTDFVQDALDALVPEGTLTIMRPDGEADRVTALVAHALRARGSRAPATHLFGCAREKLSTVLVKRTPLESDELSTLRAHCRRHKFVEILSPDGVKDEARKALMAGVNPVGLSIGQSTDLRPPTDDRPFWFHSVPSGRVGATLLDVRDMMGRQRTLFVLAAGALIALVVGLFALLLSLVSPSRFWGYRSRMPVTHSSIALAAVTASMVFLGQALVGRMSPIVGRTDVAGLVLPLVFLLAISFGAGFGGRFDEDDLRAGLQRWLLATMFLLAPLMMGLEAILSAVVDLPLVVRIGLLALIVGFVGGGVGAGLGLAVRSASTWGLRTCACSIACAGAMAASAMLFGAFLSMTWGYSATLLAGAAAMMIAVTFAASARIEVPHDPAAFEPLSPGETASDDEPMAHDDSVSSSTAVSV